MKNICNAYDRQMVSAPYIFYQALAYQTENTKTLREKRSKEMNSSQKK